MISMTRQGTSRQSADDTHRHSPVLVGMGLIGVVLMATAELVLITTGLNAARLDPDPTWALDCDDTTCTDPWAGARTHYWWVAAGSVVLGLVGWATVGASRPAWRTAPLRRLPRPVPLTGLSASPFLALVPALAALVVSWPMLGAVICAAAAAVSRAVWADMRARTGRDRLAWFAGGLVPLAGLLAWGTAAALAWPLLFVLAAVVALLPAGLAMAGALAAVERALGRGAGPSRLAESTDAPSASTARPARAPWWSFAVSGAIVLLGVLTALPVPASST